MWEREEEIRCCILYFSESAFNFSFKRNRRCCNYSEKLFVNTCFSKSFQCLYQKWPCLRIANAISSPFFFSESVTWFFCWCSHLHVEKSLKSVTVLYKRLHSSCITFPASWFWQCLFSMERKRRLRWQWITGMKLEKYHFSLGGKLGFVIGKPLHVM